MRYRVDIKGIKLDFSAVNEIDFALYATATESIRPGQFSDATDPVMKFVGKIAKAFDPLPPVVHFAPPSISWTALPDANGMARGILAVDRDPKATGYYVWEATESALLHLLQPPNTPDPPPKTPLVTRGATLKSLINTNQDKSLQAFARLNKDPITGSRTEIKLPAAASTLYVYPNFGDQRPQRGIVSLIPGSHLRRASPKRAGHAAAVVAVQQTAAAGWHRR